MCFHTVQDRSEYEAEERRRAAELKARNDKWRVALLSLVKADGELFAAWPVDDVEDIEEISFTARTLRKWHPEEGLRLDLTEVNSNRKQMRMGAIASENALRNYNKVSTRDVPKLDPETWILFQSHRESWMRAVYFKVKHKMAS